MATRLDPSPSLRGVARVLAVSLLTTLVIAGCGSGSPSPVATSTPPPGPTATPTPTPTPTPSPTVSVPAAPRPSPSPTPSPTPTSPPAGTTVTITINGINGNMSFSPNPATVKVGQKVAWKNNGGTTHTATQNAGAFDTGAIGNGQTSAAITMSTPGAFAYHCSFHPTMVGTLNVTQ